MTFVKEWASPPLPSSALTTGLLLERHGGPPFQHSNSRSPAACESTVDSQIPPCFLLTWGSQQPPGLGECSRDHFIEASDSSDPVTDMFLKNNNIFNSKGESSDHRSGRDSGRKF